MGSGKWAASVVNFVFAFFCSGNPTAVGYNSGSGQWVVKSGKYKVGSEGGSVGNRFRVG